MVELLLKDSVKTVPYNEAACRSAMKYQWLVVIGLLFFCFIGTENKSFAFVNENERDNMLQSSYAPPLIENVTIQPEQPAANDEVKITATIYNDSSLTEDKTTGATLLYSADDGKSWEKVEMEQSESDEKQWAASLPSQASGTTVRFYIQATDTSNTTTSESRGMTTPQSEKDWLPSEDSMTLVCDDEDDDIKETPDHLDLRKFFAGYDDKYFYAKLVFEGKVPTQGGDCATQPLYYMQAENVDKGWLHYGWLFYRPCTYNNGPNQYGFVQKDWYNEQVRDSQQIDQVIKDNVIYWRWKRDFQNSPKNALWLYFEDRSGIPPENIKYQNNKQLQAIKVYVEATIYFWAKDIYDLSTPIRFYLTTHSYEVK